MIQTILFDLDNTLLDFNRAESVALTKTLIQLGIEPKQSIINRYSELNLMQWKLLEQGKLSRNEVKVRRYQLLFEEIQSDCSPQEAAKIYESQLGIGHYFVEGAQELLDTLVDQYDMYLVTNGTAHVQKSRIESAQLKPYFDDIFISEEIGFNKPSKEYFHACFEQIPAFTREKTIIIGDSLSSDIQGGKNAGIATIWFNPTHETNTSNVIPDYEIDHLSQIPTILNEYGNDSR